MAAGGLARIDALSRENYDTWKLHMEALLVKNDAWDYVSGVKVKPEVIDGNAESQRAYDAWKIADRKAKSDIVLCIGSSELKIIKGCNTSREIWLRLENTYQSKGPARKAALLKQLILQRMQSGGDVREHLRRFFDAVDKLGEMDIDINKDLLAILLLYSLPSTFDNFRCAIESRDDLPQPEALRVKIIEESDARRQCESSDSTSAFIAKKRDFKGYGAKKKVREDGPESKREVKKIQCFRCRKFGHKSTVCTRGKDDREQSARSADYVTFLAECARSGGEREMDDDAAYVDRANVWCLDSGCSSHVAKNRYNFVEIREIEPEKLHLANETSTNIGARGKVRIAVEHARSIKAVDLTDALHVPDLRTNLMSVGKITDRGYRVIFDKNGADIVDKSGVAIISAERINGLYYVKTSPRECAASAKSSRENLLRLWHRRMGHLNVKDLIEATTTGTIEGIGHIKGGNISCDVCIQGKMARAPFPKRSDRCSDLLDMMHSDVCGPTRTESLGKSRYFVTFIDEASGWCEVRFLSKKSGVFAEFVRVKALFEKQTGKVLKCLQTDNGKEYTSTEFNQFLGINGIQRRLTVPNNPEQNGIAERRNRTLVEMARCMLLQAGLPQTFWAEAVWAANYVRNRCPSKSLGGKTPFEVRFGKKPNVSCLREFGCDVFVLDRTSAKGKFDAKTKKGICLGNSEESKGYRVWIPEDRRVIVSRDVKFSEDTLARSPTFGVSREAHTPAGTNASGEIDVLLQTPQISRERIDESPHRGSSEDSDGEDEEETWEDAEVAMRRGPGRPRKILTGKRGRPRLQYNLANADVAEEIFLAEVPIKQAVSSPDSAEWFDAMAAELKNMLANHTWDLVDRPTDHHVIGSRMVLRNKYGPDGSLERRKARIVARGFSQRPGIDFSETFAPVARLGSIRLAAALASNRNLTIRQFDVTAAYLNGTVTENIFMEVPEMTEELLELIVRAEPNGKIKQEADKMLRNLRRGNKVCRLNKALYGLRQSGRQWHEKFDEVLRSMGFVPTKADPCVYTTDQGGEVVILVIYVDDILVIADKRNHFDMVRNGLRKHFDVKEIGDVKCCVGLEFNRHDDGYSIHQRGQIKDVLARFGMSECKPVSTPMDANVKLSRNSTSGASTEPRVPYRELIGSLMYIAMGSRPDIAHAVSRLSTFNDCHQPEHWVAAKRVLRYLKGTLDYGVSYSRTKDDSLIGYVDSDWGNCPDDRRSYSGYAFKLAGAAVTWESRKQRTVALSSTEAEYMGISDGVKEAIYLRRFLKELRFENADSVEIMCDNVGAIKLASNPIHHSRTKHIDIRHHFVREVLETGDIKLDYVPTDDMAADILTKGLPTGKHRNCVRLLGVYQCPA